MRAHHITLGLLTSLFLMGCASVQQASAPPPPAAPSASITRSVTPTWTVEVAEVKAIQRVLVDKSVWQNSRVCRQARVGSRVSTGCYRQVVLVRPYTTQFGQGEQRVFLITYRYLDEIHSGVLEVYEDDFIDVYVDAHTGRVLGVVDGQ